MHPQLLDILAAHPDCYFQIFTNGQFITDEVAAQLRRLGNATPLISLEGREIVSDERRGRKDVFNKSLRGLDNCLRHRLLTGPRCEPTAVARLHDVIRESHTERQSTLLVRANGHVYDSSWELHEVDLEEIALAYLGRRGPATAKAREAVPA